MNPLSSETLYKTLIERMNEALWMGDENEITVYVNPRFCELSGYSEKEALGRKCWDFWDEQTIKKIKKEHASKRKKGQGSTYEGNLITKTGDIIPCSISGASLEDGGSMGIITDLRELKNKESMYQRLVEHMNEAVWMGDENEVTVYANPKFCELMEYELEEMIGRESYDFWDKESAELVRSTNFNKRKKGVSSSYEGNLLTKSGKLIPVYLSGTPLADGGTIGIMTDLRELKKKEVIYRKLAEHMTEGVCVQDEHENTLYVNPSFCRITGFTEAEAMKKSATDFLDEASGKKARHETKTKRAQGQSSEYEAHILTKKGERVPVRVSGVPLPDGGSMGIAMDLREIKEKEDTEKMLNSALEYANDAIVIFDVDHKIVSWNKGAKIIFGYRKKDMVGENLSRIFDEKDIDNLIQQSSDVVYNFEIAAQHQNKNQLNLSINLSPVFKKGKKKPSFYLLIARDITHQSKIAEELSEKYKKIGEAYQEMGLMRRQMDYMFELCSLPSNEKNQKRIAHFIVSSMVMLAHVDACALRLYRPDKDVLELISCFGFAEDWTGKWNLKFKNSLAEKAFLSKSILKIMDVTKEPRYQSSYLAKKNNLYSLCLIPLTSNGKLVGTLSLYTTPEKTLEIFENEFIEKYAKLIELVVATTQE